ncbi:hypothetical protein DFQ27_002122, partial [Actinomortierella ambigua]
GAVTSASPGVLTFNGRLDRERTSEPTFIGHFDSICCDDEAVHMLVAGLVQEAEAGTLANQRVLMTGRVTVSESNKFFKHEMHVDKIERTTVQ